MCISDNKKTIAGFLRGAQLSRDNAKIIRLTSSFLSHHCLHEHSILGNAQEYYVLFQELENTIEFEVLKMMLLTVS